MTTVTENTSIIVIPARLASTRFPEKPKALIKGIPMLERVWRIAQASKAAERVIIATESSEIVDFASSFGAEVMLTSDSCQTGTDRVAEVAGKLGCSKEIMLSFQGDSVLTPAHILDQLIHSFSENPSQEIATPACKLEGQALSDFVKSKQGGSSTGTMVVFNNDDEALYFSRSIIPFKRGGEPEEIYRHIGMYAYRADTLKKFSSLPMGRLEKLEKLEQLRALENGIGIKVVPVSYRGRTAASVDNPEDIEAVEAIIDREGELPEITRG